MCERRETKGGSKTKRTFTGMKRMRMRRTINKMEKNKNNVKN
jgi:hypothetical protein